MPYGIGRSGGGHPPNSVEAWFVNTPGLKVCIPSTPADARGLLKTAIRDPDPVLVFEHRGLYRVTGEVPEAETLVPLGVADVKRPGRDATVIATARMVHASLEAARRLAGGGGGGGGGGPPGPGAPGPGAPRARAPPGAPPPGGAGGARGPPRRLAEEGIEVEVVDPRSLVPLDRETL